MQAQARVPAPHNQKREEYDKNQELSRNQRCAWVERDFL
jgi:hypothetical protein